MSLLQFNSVLITPYTELIDSAQKLSSHRGGPHWPHFPQQLAVRHCRAGHPIDDEPLEPSTIPINLSGTFAWGGALVNHFGHQIADFSMRLGPTLLEFPTARFIFAVRKGKSVKSYDDLPEFFKGILQWFNISPDRLHVVDRPTVVERLVVAPQAEQLLCANGPDDQYLDYLDELIRTKRFDHAKNGIVYVSRAGQRSRFAGEGYIEQILMSIGVRVVRPENLKLEEQLRQYLSADLLVFSEGSAIHAVQLIGRCLSKVVVLLRRSDIPSKTKGNGIWKPVLQKRSKSVECSRIFLGQLYPKTLSGFDATWLGLSIISEEALFSELSVILGDASYAAAFKKKWHTAVFKDECRRDIIEWLSDLSTDSSALVAPSASLILNQLEELGLSSLKGDAEQILRMNAEAE